MTSPPDYMAFFVAQAITFVQIEIVRFHVFCKEGKGGRKRERERESMLRVKGKGDRDTTLGGKKRKRLQRDTTLGGKEKEIQRRQRETRAVSIRKKW